MGTSESLLTLECYLIEGFKACKLLSTSSLGLFRYAYSSLPSCPNLLFLFFPPSSQNGEEGGAWPNNQFDTEMLQAMILASANGWSPSCVGKPGHLLWRGHLRRLLLAGRVVGLVCLG